jgi:sortase A
MDKPEAGDRGTVLNDRGGALLPRRLLQRSRAVPVLLLLLIAVLLSSCGGAAGLASEEGAQTATRAPEQVENAGPGTTGPAAKAPPQETPAAPPSEAGSEPPESVPKYEDFFAPSDEAPKQQATGAGSAGAIPNVKPFNFGRDPGGPKDKTLYVSIPKLGLEDVPVFDSVKEEKLTEGTVHVPATGFPWQEGANTYIAGHRIGYPNTGSYKVFYDLDLLAPGDEILVRDSDGGEYTYRVTSQVVVGPDDVEVMNPVEGKNVVTLQTCTLPDYKDRIIVQGELV